MKFLSQGVTHLRSRCSIRIIVNGFLVLIAVLAATKVVFDLQNNVASVQTDTQIPLNEKRDEDLSLPQPSLRPISGYEERIKARNIFSLDQRNEAKQLALTATSPAAEAILQPYKNLKLRGIVLDDDPLAILQDPQTRESFIVRKGEELKETIVKEVGEERVVLEYYGQVVELVR